ncbi:DUF6303 family protein [Streptomyces sp. N35]|uniref:DUF6303 family protein n=1 Tax=Streptomyces sp. N35 TaxID=2795730 RepID=UPI0018F57759|nr:DUF6303 family protein [Streptomyces sp. N35]
MSAHPTPETAQLHRVCCDYGPGVARGDVRRARWELYVVVYGTYERWPAHRWPTSRRHHIPTPEQRIEALAELDYRPAEGAVWEWQESDTPDYHGHPSEPSLLGSIRIVPLGGAS